jgi:hypothetical protein
VTTIIAGRHIPIQFGYRSGVYYYASFGSLATSTESVAADTLYAAPITIEHRAIFTALCVEVTTLAAGNVRMGIYNNNPSAAYPSSLVVDGGAASTDSTGFKEITISQALTPGMYWLVAVYDATPTIRRLTGNAHTVGAKLGTNQAADSSGDMYSMVSVALPYGALPSIFPSEGTYVSNTQRYGLKA